MESPWSTPEAVAERLYALISGPAEEERDWDAFRELFHPGARLIVAFTHPDGGTETREWTPWAFARHAADDYRNHGGFWERETCSIVERFGGVAHVWSIFESRRGSEESEPFGRGINSIQLLRCEGRWWISNLVWDLEQPHNRIPSTRGDYASPQASSATRGPTRVGAAREPDHAGTAAASEAAGTGDGPFAGELLRPPAEGSPAEPPPL